MVIKRNTNVAAESASTLINNQPPTSEPQQASVSVVDRPLSYSRKEPDSHSITLQHSPSAPVSSSQRTEPDRTEPTRAEQLRTAALISVDVQRHGQWTHCCFVPVVPAGQTQRTLTAD